MWPILLSGFTLGAAGSLHCVGMCGPLSLALPIHQFSPARKFFSLLSYQFGRIFTYSFIGLIFGLAGRRIYLAGYQQAFSITMGTIILFFAFLYFFHRRTVHFKLFNRFYFFIQQQIVSLLRSANGLPGFFLMGIANGFLPCGMVYFALAATLSLTGISQSVAFMAMYGAGTLPAMMLVGYAGQLMRPGIRISFRKLVPVFIALMGVMLILRGFDLGIPFLSPALPHSPGQAVICHP